MPCSASSQRPQTACGGDAVGHPRALIDIERSKQLVLPEQPTWTARLRGEQPNRDTFVS